MKKVQFIFGIHNHQPVGNFDYVFEEAFLKSYLPFIEILERHPRIAMALHFSGCLLEWLEDRYPEFLDRIAELVKRGNIEIMAAGFYEPILAIIPDKDKLGQINKLRDYIQQRFNYTARGSWLTERVWEPHLAKPIQETGIEYITVDDYHFIASGKELNDLTGYFNTDEQGHTIGVFPISQRLRYAMPFKDPEATIEILRDYATEDGNNVIVMADDGEKFGLWPGTNENCYGPNQWLERFFTALEENQDWIKTTTFKDYYHNNGPLGLVFLPTVSYFEMSEWTLPAEQGLRFVSLVDRFGHNGTMEKVRPFLRGGTWRNFQALYGESNWMQKRMTQVSYRLEAIANTGQLTGPDLAEARNNLWRAQCNCAYWHGVFGGLYLPHLRHAIYTHLLTAEKTLDKIAGINTDPSDIDKDGATECVLQSADMKAIVSSAGGSIKELDVLARDFNLVNTMRRYNESYHAKVTKAVQAAESSGSIHDLALAKEEGLEEYLQFDPWPRRVLQDHFFENQVSAKDLRREFPEKGNLPEIRYQIEQDGSVYLTGLGVALQSVVEINKKLRLDGNQLTIDLSLINRGDDRLCGIYASELNFSLLGGHTPDRYYLFNGKKPKAAWLDSLHDLENIGSVAIVNEWDHFKLNLIFNSQQNIACYPVETVSMSEAGFERVYQSSVILPFWQLNLMPGEQFETQVTLTIELLD